MCFFLYTMLEYFVIAIAVFFCPTQAEEKGFYVTPNNTLECVNDLVRWCDGMEYPQEGAGMSMISVNIADHSGYSRVLCVVDNDGTNCSRNGQPWFSCSKDNKLFYKGNQLNKGSAEGVDDDVCQTTSQAFNNLLIQNFSYNNETIVNTMEKALESFFKQMATMQKQIENLNLRISSMFGNNFPFWSGDSSDERSIEDESIREEYEFELQ